jgi:hypothetical protein
MGFITPCGLKQKAGLQIGPRWRIVPAMTTFEVRQAQQVFIQAGQIAYVVCIGRAD